MPNTPVSSGPPALSSAQRRLWFLERLHGPSAMWNVTVPVRLHGALDLARLETAVSQLAERHPILRARIATGIEPTISIGQSTGLTVVTTPMQWHAALSQEAATPIDLERQPWLRSTLYVLGEHDHLLVLTVHHIAIDGWSISVLVNDLVALWRGDALAPAPSFFDLTAQPHETSSRWRERLAGAPATLPIPYDHSGHDTDVFVGDVVRMSIPSETRTQVELLARQNRTTPASILLACLNALLYRWTGAEDIVIGVPVSTRSNEAASAVGPFMNTVPVRTSFDAAAPVTELIDRTRRALFAAAADRHVPFEDMVSGLQVERSLEDNPIFQVLFAYQNYPRTTAEFEGLRIEVLDWPVAATDLPLSVLVHPIGDSFDCLFKFQPARLRRTTVERLTARFGKLVSDISVLGDQLAAPVSSLDISVPSDATAVRCADGGTLQPDQRSLWSVFETGTYQWAQRFAVSEGTDRHSYHALLTRSLALAAELETRGVRPGDAVGIIGARTWQTLALQLAIARRGARFVPLDASWPAERLARVVSTADIRLTMTGTEITAAMAERPEAAHHVAPDDIAYEIYTSGSTGQPKGVRVPHSALLATLTTIGQVVGLGPADRTAALTTPSFDISLFEMLSPLLVGAEVLLPPGVLAPETAGELAAWLRQSQPTIIQTTPSGYRMILAAGWSPTATQRLIVGGEALTVDLAEQLTSDGARVYNFYGPTETCIWSSYFDCGQGWRDGVRHSVISIGMPLPGEGFVIVGPHGEIQPPGCPGELLIAGVGLAAGYGDAALTEARFVAHPARPGELAYRTGDSAVQALDGSFHYLGRLDRQTKIRGIRIELDEIRIAALDCDEVRDAFALLTATAGGHQVLTCFVELASPSELDEAALWRAFRRHLPTAAVPSQLVAIDALPLTPNGKVDVNALLALASAQASQGTEPTTDDEAGLLDVLRAVLGAHAGVDDNFFGLGGDSITALEFTDRANRAGYRFSVREVFKRPTVRSLASACDIWPEAALPSLEPFALCSPAACKEILAAVPDAVDAWPLSAMQSAMRLQADRHSGGVYVEQLVARLESYDVDRIERAWHMVCANEPVLRSTVVEADGGRLFQAAADTMAAPFERATATSLEAWLAADRARGFGSVLARLSVVATPDGDALVFTFHHMVLDGFSVTSLMTEFQATYENRGQADKPGSFASFVSWQQMLDESALHAYWSARLSEVERPTGTPLAAVKPTAAGIIGAQARLPLEHDEWSRMESAASRYRVTVSTLIHGAWALVLGHYLGTDTVTIGSTESGRTTVPSALRRTRGLMLNTFPFVVELAWDVPAQQWLQSLHTAYRDDVEWAGYPLAKIQAITRPVLPPGRRLFESLITFERFPWMSDRLPTHETSLRIADVTLHEVAEFPLLLEVVAGEAPKVLFRYDQSMLRPDDVAALMGALQVAMRELVDGGHRMLRELRVFEHEAVAHRWRAEPAQRTEVGFVERLHRIVASSPDAVAVRAEDGTELTYRQLWQRAGSVANTLADRGHGPGSTIAVLADRRCDSVAAIVGVLRAGCTYLPLEPDLPPARLELMLRNGNSACLLVTGETVSVDGVETIALVGLLPEAEFPGVAIGEGDCAYVIFTSGSTGEPKATEVPHKALNAFLDACGDEFGVGTGDVFLAATAYTFDISLLELLYPLVSGATVAIIDRTTVRDAQQLIAALRAIRPQWIQATPSFYRMLLAAGWRGGDDLKLLCGGEAMTRELADSLLDRCERAWNCYGPTETTIWSSFHEITLRRDELADRGAVSLGRPALGEQLHVLAPNGAPTPPGGVGELCISGAGLALGYRGRPDLTAESFVDLPYGRIYRTGDYVRTSRTDTALEFVGRRDRQLKVRGYRLELQEIERALLDQPAIAEAVAMPSADGAGVVAAVVIQETVVVEGDLLAELRSRLPAYLVPAILVIVDAIPRLPSGKTDRAGLLAAIGARATVAAVQPRTNTEAALQVIWADVLEVRSPSVTASLFDLGGHSLLANLIVSRMEDHFGVRISVAALFQRPTIEATARLIDAEQAERITEDPELARLLAELEGS